MHRVHCLIKVAVGAIGSADADGLATGAVITAAAEGSSHHAIIAVWSEAAVVMGEEDNPHVELPVIEDLPALQNVHDVAPVLDAY